MVRTFGVCTILTWKCASRHSGVHFFNISTSKSGLSMVIMVCFVHFDLSSHNSVHFFDISTSKSGQNVRCFYLFYLQMCFAPQRCAIFHLSSGHLAPHPPLSRGYFSTLRSHKSLKKRSESRLSYLFAHLLSSHFLTSPSGLFPPLLFHLCILSEV